MSLFILRHGLAIEHGTPGYADDASRPLTVEGKAKLRKITRAMEKLDLHFDVILSSPYQRARQTAEITAEELDLVKKLAFSDALIPDGSAKELISHINQLKPRPENILLVGHEPYLSELISVLVFGGRGFSVELKKGGLAKLSMESLKHGRCASLEWLLTPKQMALIGA